MPFLSLNQQQQGTKNARAIFIILIMQLFLAANGWHCRSRCWSGVLWSWSSDFGLVDVSDDVIRSTSSSSLTVRRTRLSTVGDRAFPVAAAHTWNSLPQHVTSAPSMSVFWGRLKAFLFQAFLSMTRYLNFCSGCAVTVVIFGHKSFFLLTSNQLHSVKHNQIRKITFICLHLQPLL